MTLIFLVVLIDLLGMSLIIPLAPFYADRYGASDLLIGLIIAAYPLAQFLAAPHLGHLSDRFGRRPVLLVSLAGTLTGFLIWAGAEPLARLFSVGLDFNGAVLFWIVVGRLLDGLSGGNITVCQAYITDITDEKSRSGGLGMIGAAHGLGFIVGPPLGGYLSADGDFALPALVAAAIALVNWLGVLFFLPESFTQEARSQVPPRPLRWVDIDSYRHFLSRPQVGPMLAQSLVFGLVFGMFQMSHSLYNLRRFSITPDVNGLILAYAGVLMVVIQGFLIGRLSARFDDARLLQGGLALSLAAFVAWAWAPTIPALLGVLALMALGGGVANVTYRSALTKMVSSQEIGRLFGVKASLGSLLGIAAPTLGSGLLDRFGTAAPGLFGALALLALYSTTRAPS